MISLLNKKTKFYSQTNHKYHLVDPRPWPIFVGSFGKSCLTKPFFNSCRSLSNNIWASSYFEDFSKSLSFCVLHDFQYFVNITPWFRSIDQIQKIIESTEFQVVLAKHNQRYPEETGIVHYYFDNNFYCHPVLALYFASKVNEELYNLIFGQEGFDNLKCYQKMINFLGLFNLDVHSYECVIVNTNTEKSYTHSDIIKLHLIENLKNKLQIHCWKNLQFKKSFICFSTNSNDFICGSIKPYATLASQLKDLKKKYPNLKLLYVFKFYSSERLSEFDKSIRNLIPSSTHFEKIVGSDFIRCDDTEKFISDNCLKEYFYSYSYCSSLLPQFYMK